MPTNIVEIVGAVAIAVGTFRAVYALLMQLEKPFDPTRSWYVTVSRGTTIRVNREDRDRWLSQWGK